jgi:DNA modification methylase
LLFDLKIKGWKAMVAAENVKRRCFGIEISPEYVACDLQRMTDAFPGIGIERIEK